MGDVGCRESPAKGDERRDDLALRLEALNERYGRAVVDTRVQADLVKEEDISVNSTAYPSDCEDKNSKRGQQRCKPLVKESHVTANVRRGDKMFLMLDAKLCSFRVERCGE